MARQISLRGAYLLGSLGCAGLLAYAYYLQYFRLLDPCPLCMVQRLAFCAIGVLFLAGAVHNPARAGAWFYGTVITLIAALGTVAAGRHLALQSVPPSELLDCGPGLVYMIENWPLSQTLKSLVSGQCVGDDWQLLGLSMPGWSLIGYLLLAAWALLAIAWARPRRRRIFLDH